MQSKDCSSEFFSSRFLFYVVRFLLPMLVITILYLSIEHQYGFMMSATREGGIPPSLVQLTYLSLTPASESHKENGDLMSNGTCFCLDKTANLCSGFSNRCTCFRARVDLVGTR